MSNVTAHIIPMPSSRLTRRRPSDSWRVSIRRSCSTTRRRNSPTAASSASGRRLGSPPGGCMRAARSESNSSRPSNIACAAPAKHAHEAREDEAPPRGAAGRSCTAAGGPHRAMSRPSGAPRKPKDRRAAPIMPLYRIPPHVRGQRIGLFGGTFDPPHDAHLAASLLTLKRLALDRVWWLVTPGNPLKDTDGLAPLERRVAAARALTRHARIVVTGIEAEIGVRYTYDTIRYLVSRCPGVHFVWIMGADNLRSFHRWQRWRDLAALVPIAVVDRPGPSLYAIGSVSAQALGRRRIPEGAAVSLPMRRPPAWVLLHGLKSPLCRRHCAPCASRKNVVESSAHYRSARRHRPHRRPPPRSIRQAEAIAVGHVEGAAKCGRQAARQLKPLTGCTYLMSVAPGRVPGTAEPKGKGLCP